MRQCPNCNAELKEGDRFCLGCGRQIDIDTTDEYKSSEVSDRKQCYGSFPKTATECYLCADEQKCSNYTLCTRQRYILNKLDTLYNFQTSLSAINDSLRMVIEYLKSIRENTHYIATRSK